MQNGSIGAFGISGLPEKKILFSIVREAMGNLGRPQPELDMNRYGFAMDLEKTK